MIIDYPKDWTHNQKLILAKTLFYIHGNDELNFNEFLKDELARLDKKNRTEPDELLFRQQQGACQVLQELIAMLEKGGDMHDTLKEVERNQERRSNR